MQKKGFYPNYQPKKTQIEREIKIWDLNRGVNDIVSKYRLKKYRYDKSMVFNK